MTPEEKVKALRRLLIASEAQCLHWFRMLREGEVRDWEELPAEEQEARLWYAEYLLDKQHPGLVA